MKKTRKLLLLTLILTLLFSSNVWGTSYYSYNKVGLNYGKTGSFYGPGKNGYKWVQVTSINGSKIKYRYAKFAYSRAEGHSIIKSYGKTYTAKLTGNTRYYKSAPWTKLNSVQAYRYSYHSQSFKKLKILIKSNKWNMFGTYYQNGSFYIKISKGKVKIVISPVIFAM